VFYQSGAEVRGGLLHFEPVQALFGYCVGVAGELGGRDARYG
jgi:hypothetical protein